MKKNIWFFMILIISANLVACKKEYIEEEPKLSLYPIYERKDNEKKWGYMDSEGRLVIPGSYHTVSNFNEGLAIVEKSGYFGLVNLQGQEVLRPNFDNIRDLKNGYIAGFKGDKIEIYREDGLKLDLGNRYLNVGNFKDGYFSVISMDENKDHKFGYINLEGEEVLKPIYDMAYDFYKGKAIVKLGDKFQIIDKKGNVFKELSCNFLGQTSDDRYYIYSDNSSGYGLMSIDGTVILKDDYPSIVDVEEDLIVFVDYKEDIEHFGLKNIKGQTLLEAKYSDIRILGSGYVAVSEEVGILGKNIYTILDEKLKEISPLKYYNVGGFEGGVNRGLISVCDERKTYFLDLKGEVSDLVEPIVGYGQVSYDGKVIKSLVDDELRYYDMDGAVLWEEDNTYNLSENVQIIEKKYRDFEGVNIKYPRLIGLKDRELQNLINENLELEFFKDKGLESKFLEARYAYYKTNYGLDFRGKILTLEKRSRILPREILEEQLNREFYNIDLETGDFYRLEDILKSEDKLEILNELLEKKLVKDGRKPYYNFRGLTLDSDFVFRENFGFYLDLIDNQNVVYDYIYIEVDKEEVEGIVDFEADFFKGLKEGN